MNRWLNTAFLVSFILLAFSTSRDEGIVLPPGYLGLFLVTPIIFFAKRRHLTFKISSGLILIFLSIFFILPSVFSIYSSTPYASLWRASAHVIGYLIFLSYFSDKDIHSRRILELSLICFTSTVAVYYIIHFLLASLNYGWVNVLFSRESGGLAELPWGASNVVAAVIFLGFCLSFTMPESRILRITQLIMVAAILLTLSRTVIVGVLVIIIAVGYKFILKNIITLSIVSTIITRLYLNVDGKSKVYLDNLIQNRTSSVNGRDFNGRGEIWMEYWYKITTYQYPIGYYESLNLYGHTSHNVYLSTWIEQGPIGIIFLLCIFAYITLISLRKKRYDIFIVILVLQITLFFEDVQYTHQHILAFWVLLTLWSNYLMYPNPETRRETA